MESFCDFEEQFSLKTADGRLRPDLIVRLPGDRIIEYDGRRVFSSEVDVGRSALESDWGTLTSITSFTDVDLSGGSSYSYYVQALTPDGCISGPSNCADAVATGDCTLLPTFGGLESVVDDDTATTINTVTAADGRRADARASSGTLSNLP